MRIRTVGRTVGAAAAVALALVVALVITAAVRWLLGGNGHPFGDARACAGTELPLDRALDAKGITLPPDATDVHYVATSQNGRVALAVAFHSTRQTMAAYLEKNGLDPNLVDHLGRGSFAMEGDGVLTAPGLCGTTLPGGVLIPQRSTTDQAFDVALQVENDTIRSTTEVILTAWPRPAS